MQKVKKDADRRTGHDKKKDIRFGETIRDPLNIDELAYALTDRLEKKDAPGKLCQSSTENKPFFNKDQISVVRKRVKVSNN